MLYIAENLVLTMKASLSTVFLRLCPKDTITHVHKKKKCVVKRWKELKYPTIIRKQLKNYSISKQRSKKIMQVCNLLT